MLEHRRAFLVLLACACAPDDLAPLPIDVCGQDTAKQILALGDDEFVDPYSGVARFGERWLFGVRRFEIPLTSIHSTLYIPEARPFAQLDARVESVGPCGEDRHVVAEDVDLVFPPTADDQPWLGCRRDTGELYWFDPDGAWAARPIGRSTFACSAYAVRGHDVFFPVADTGDFVRARLSDDGVVVDVLVTDVVQTSPFYSLGEPVVADDVFLLRGKDRVIVRVDLATAAVEEVLHDVDEFSMHTDRRWLVRVRRIPNDPNDVSVPAGGLVDLAERSERYIGLPEWPDVRVGIGDGFAWAQGLEENGLPFETEVIAIPSLDSQFVASAATVLGSDGGNFMAIATSTSGVDVLDMTTGHRRSVLEEPTSYTVQDGTLLYDDRTAWADLDMPQEYRPVDVVRLPLATLEPEMVYERVFSGVELPGDRWLATSEIDENELADLDLVDGDTLELRRVDRNVVPPLRPYDPHLALEFHEPWSTDDLVYQVHERASDRGGIWRVRFAE